MVARKVILDDDETDSYVQDDEVAFVKINIITQTFSQFKSFNVDFDPQSVFKKHTKSHVCKIAFFQYYI